MKKFIPLLFFLIVFLIPSAFTFAQAPSQNSATQTSATGGCPTPIEINGYFLCPSNPPIVPGTIDTGVHWVAMTIPSIPPQDDGSSGYFYCLKSDPKNCDDDDLKSISASNGTITFAKLCGDGETKLKTNCSDSGSDFFHEGKTYRVSIFNKKKSKSGNVIFDAPFYVSQFYPKVTLQPGTGQSSALSENALKNGGKLHVKLEGRNQKDTGSESDKYNDYWLQVEGLDNNYKSSSVCAKIPSGTQTWEGDIALLPTDTLGNTLTAGNYVLKIKDVKGNCEENDFSYYYIPFRIGVGGEAGAMGDPEQSRDPFQKETGIKKPAPTPVPVCPPEDRDGNGYCTSIATGLGIKIHTEPQLFVRDIFRVVLSIAGVIAILFFTRAGYVLMTSAGNKERVGGAREQITSAIMGIIFIILSITILEFIGIDILQIPGFTR